MKKLNKKGFTIVELVIVMAVIAILAAVLIPTFSGVINNAKESAALQNARSTYNELAAYELDDGDWDADYAIVSGDYAFVVDNGVFNATPVEASTITAENYDALTVEGATWTTGVKVAK